MAGGLLTIGLMAGFGERAVAQEFGQGRDTARFRNQDDRDFDRTDRLRTFGRDDARFDRLRDRDVRTFGRRTTRFPDDDRFPRFDLRAERDRELLRQRLDGPEGMAIREQRLRRRALDDGDRPGDRRTWWRDRPERWEVDWRDRAQVARRDWNEWDGRWQDPADVRFRDELRIREQPRWWDRADRVTIGPGVGFPIDPRDPRLLDQDLRRFGGDRRFIGDGFQQFGDDRPLGDGFRQFGDDRRFGDGFRQFEGGTRFGGDRRFGAPTGGMRQFGDGTTR